MWPRVFVDESLDVHKWGIELGTGVIKLTHRVIGPEEFTGDELPTLRHSERPYKKPPPKPLSAEELEQYEDAEEQLKKLLHGEIETWEVERGVLRIFLEVDDEDQGAMSELDADRLSKRSRLRVRLRWLARQIESAQNQRRGKVRLWSPQSRRRMIQQISRVAWEGKDWAMLTLTYPDDWESVAGSPDLVKAHLEAFWERWIRKWGSRLKWNEEKQRAVVEAIWKLEFQGRGAPHFHILIRLPKGVGVKRIKRETRSMWADIVGATGDDRINHERRGAFFSTQYRHFEGPNAIARYFSKHGLWGHKEYQHEVPDAWQNLDRGTGRWWGIKGLDRPMEAIEISEDEAITIRRLIKRWKRSQQFYARKMRVDCVGNAHGVLVRPRLRSFEGALGGGWVALDDAPGLLAQIRDFIARERWGPPDRKSLPVGMRGPVNRRDWPFNDEMKQVKPVHPMRNPVPGVVWDTVAHSH